MSQNLIPGGKGRRTILKDVIEYLSPEEILEKITRKEWPYKRNITFYVTRDRALLALLYLTSGRINEVLRLSKGQFKEDEEDPDFLVVNNFWVSKRWKGGMRKKRKPIFEGDTITGYTIIEEYVPPSRHPIIPIPLPRVGRLAPFTKMVEEYLGIMEDDRLFKFGSSRALQIVEHITGMWCHWFRDQSLSYFVNTIRGTILSVARQRGKETDQTLDHYYRGGREQHKEDLKK